MSQRPSGFRKKALAETGGNFMDTNYPYLRQILNKTLMIFSDLLGFLRFFVVQPLQEHQQHQDRNAGDN